MSAKLFVEALAYRPPFPYFEVGYLQIFYSYSWCKTITGRPYCKCFMQCAAIVVGKPNWWGETPPYEPALNQATTFARSASSIQLTFAGGMAWVTPDCT